MQPETIYTNFSNLPLPIKQGATKPWLLVSVGVVLSLVISFIISIITINGPNLIIAFDFLAGIALGYGIYKIAVYTNCKNHKTANSLLYVLIGILYLSQWYFQYCFYALNISVYSIAPFSLKLSYFIELLYSSSLREFFNFILKNFRNSGNITSVNTGIIGGVLLFILQVYICLAIAKRVIADFFVKYLVQQIPEPVVVFVTALLQNNTTQKNIIKALAEKGWAHPNDQENALLAALLPHYRTTSEQIL
jgi:hypothetical protein